MLELETLFVVVNVVLCEFGPRFCLCEYGTSMAPKMTKASFKSILEKIFKN